MSNRRPQKAKPNRHVTRVQELRRSNAATAIPSGTTYSRKPKHVKKGWSE